MSMEDSRVVFPEYFELLFTGVIVFGEDELVETGEEDKAIGDAEKDASEG